MQPMPHRISVCMFPMKSSTLRSRPASGTMAGRRDGQVTAQPSAEAACATGGKGERARFEAEHTLSLISPRKLHKSASCVGRWCWLSSGCYIQTSLRCGCGVCCCWCMGLDLSFLKTCLSNHAARRPLSFSHEPRPRFHRHLPRDHLLCIVLRPLRPPVLRPSSPSRVRFIARVLAGVGAPRSQPVCR